MSNAPEDVITLDMLRRYLVECDNPKPVKDGPTPKSVEPTLRGFWFWCREHKY